MPATAQQQTLIKSKPLDDLADSANAADAAVKQHLRSAVVNARDCGEALAEAKDQLPHGSFEDWVVTNCQFSRSKAQRYLRIYSHWASLSKASRMTFLDCESINAALRIIAAEKREAKPVTPKPCAQCEECGGEMMPTPSGFIVCGNGCGRLHRTDAKPAPSKVRPVTKIIRDFERLPVWDQLALLDRLRDFGTVGVRHKAEYLIQRIQ